MANRNPVHGPDGRGFAPEPSTRESLRLGEEDYERQLPPGRGPGRENGPDLRALLSRLGQDVSQLAHDEMTLAKLELRSVADALSNDLRTAGQALVKDFAKVGIALSLAMLAGLALTVGLILGLGLLLGAYWAGALIVGVVYLIAAGLFGASAARDLKTSEAMRLESTRQRAEQNRDVMAREARETQRFARDTAQEFKEHASPGGAGGVRH